MPNVNIKPFSEVESDADMHQWIREQRKLAQFLAMNYAAAAGELKAMLKQYDIWSGQHGRARRVARPLSLASLSMMLIGKYLALCLRRFMNEYESELHAARRRQPVGRRMRMGD